MIEHARLFALLNIALADATTSVFEAKYHFNFWRPSTAIRNADIDGNDDTVADPNWTPFLTTPPHPEYPAAHGAVQAAAARIMKVYFGPNHSFATTAPTVPGVSRFYDDFDPTSQKGVSRESSAACIFAAHSKKALRKASGWATGCSSISCGRSSDVHAARANDYCTRSGISVTRT